MAADDGAEDARVAARHPLRVVIDRNWHRHPALGRPLRWLGKHSPLVSPLARDALTCPDYCELPLERGFGAYL